MMSGRKTNDEIRDDGKRSRNGDGDDCGEENNPFSSDGRTSAADTNTTSERAKDDKGRQVVRILRCLGGGGLKYKCFFRRSVPKPY